MILYCEEYLARFRLSLGEGRHLTSALYVALSEDLENLGYDVSWEGNEDSITIVAHIQPDIQTFAAALADANKQIESIVNIHMRSSI